MPKTSVPFDFEALKGMSIAFPVTYEDEDGGQWVLFNAHYSKERDTTFLCFESVEQNEDTSVDRLWFAMDESYRMVPADPPAGTPRGMRIPKIINGVRTNPPRRGKKLTPEQELKAARSRVARLEKKLGAKKKSG